MTSGYPVVIDVFVPCHPKDDIKLKYCIASIKRNVTNKIGAIYVCSPSRINIPSGCNLVLDRDILQIQKPDYRGSWQYQQMLKIKQEVTSDIYLVVDCDTFFIQPVSFFRSGKPLFHITDDQHHAPYFEFMSKYGIKKEFERSFISDFMVFDRKILVEMLAKMKGMEEDLLKTNENCHFSEFETYGNYCFKNKLCETINTTKTILAKHTEWIEEEIQHEIFKCNTQTLSIHTWR